MYRYRYTDRQIDIYVLIYRYTNTYIQYNIDR